MRWWAWVLLGIVTGGAAIWSLDQQTAGRINRTRDSLGIVHRLEDSLNRAGRDSLRRHAVESAVAALEGSRRADRLGADLIPLRAAIVGLTRSVGLAEGLRDSVAALVGLSEGQTALIRADSVVLGSVQEALMAQIRATADEQRLRVRAETDLVRAEARPPVVVAVPASAPRLALGCVAGPTVTLTGVRFGASCGVILKSFRLF